MKHCWFMPIALSFFTLQLNATDAVVVARVATIATSILTEEITETLHLQVRSFESTIRMPEEVTSVILGSPGEFKAEHSAGLSPTTCSLRQTDYQPVRLLNRTFADCNAKSGQQCDV